MVTLAGGGFLAEAQCLMRRLGDDCQYCFTIFDDCTVPDALSGADISHMRQFALLREKRVWKRIPAFLVALVQAYKALLRTKPDCVVCMGTAMAVPLCIAARSMRIPSIYIESITRFERPSFTAKLIAYLKLANRLYVQWPDAVHLYPGGIYRGTIL